MTSAMITLITALCTGDAECLKEMVRLSPSTVQQASNYHDAVMFKINGVFFKQEIYDCYLKRGLKACEKEWKESEDAKFRAYQKRVAACMRGKEGEADAESKCNWSALEK